MPQRQSLLLLDLMSALVDRVTEADAPIRHLWGEAAGAARRAGVPLIYVKVSFRAGHPEVARRNKLFGAIAGAGRLSEASPDTGLHPAALAGPEDIVVTKRRVSSFAGSDLEVILRAMDVDTLVLAGLVTSGVVLATALEALDRDYRLVFLSDGCADPDQVLHDALMERFFPTRGEVVATREWIATL